MTAAALLSLAEQTWLAAVLDAVAEWVDPPPGALHVDGSDVNTPASERREERGRRGEKWREEKSEEKRRRGEEEQKRKAKDKKTVW